MGQMFLPPPDSQRPQPKKIKVKTKKQRDIAERKKERKVQERDEKKTMVVPTTKTADDAVQLAQIVNLHIAGYSLAQIGQAIGASADEVDRRLSSDAARYVRSQPALRTYVRNWVSDRYTQLLEAVWQDATDKSSPLKFESQDRAIRILERMEKLHGAAAPVQKEIVVEAAPESVTALVDAIAASQGLGYDTDIFDVVDAQVIETSVDQSAQLLESAGQAVEDEDDEDQTW